ncbi:glycosyltransferase family 2 protein [Nocardioides koreensis]
MSDGPRFTVITVVRNALDDLATTRASVALQDFADREHLIVDGASTDGTVEWLRGLADPDLRWVSEPDDGIYPAMNKAASMARGMYLIFLNAGDTFRGSDVLSRWARQSSRSGARWQYARAIVVDAQRRPIRPDYGLRVYSTFKHAYARAAINHQAVAMRREFFDELGGFDLQHGNVADYGLLLKAGARAQPITLDTVDIEYLDGGLSAVNPRSQWEKHKTRCDVLQYGLLKRNLDRAFALVQHGEIRARQMAKRLLMATSASGWMHRRAGRRLGRSA